MGIMLKNYKRKYWAVPSDIDCAPSNNFATQTIDAMIGELGGIFLDELQKIFK